MTERYAHVVDMAKKNPVLFIPVRSAETPPAVELTSGGLDCSGKQPQEGMAGRLPVQKLQIGKGASNSNIVNGLR